MTHTNTWIRLVINPRNKTVWAVINRKGEPVAFYYNFEKWQAIHHAIHIGGITKAIA